MNIKLFFCIILENYLLSNRLYHLKSAPFKVFQTVVLALFLRELKTRFGESRLGYVWIILEPMMHIVMLLVIFGVFKDRMMPQVPFSLFLVTGLVPYFLFQHIVNALIGSLPANLALFSYKPVRPIAVYVTRTMLEVLIYGAIFFLILIGFMWFGITSVKLSFPLEMIGITSLIILFSIAVGIALSLLIHKVPTAKIAIKIGLMILYFLSGIMYPLWIIPSEYINYLEYNPVLHLIELFRESFFSYYPHVDGISVLYPVWVTLCIGFVGLWFYTKRETLLRSST